MMIIIIKTPVSQVDSTVQKEREGKEGEER